ncbi:MAG TPA: YihY/virulence factor BrkB family protein [Thermomicrobiales bacterium]|nr:YihY/virulence factor BrkB family protein [Thermomicrobiales bacterium]
MKRVVEQAQPLIAGVRRVYAVDVLLRAWADFARGDGTIYAAAITYYVLLSLFPFLIFVVSVFGLIARDAAIQERVVNEIVDQLPPGVNLDAQIEGVVSGVAGTNPGLLGLLGLITVVWTASAVFGALRRALNRAFNVPAARSFVHGRIRDIASIIAVALLILLSMALTAVLRITHAVASDWFGDWLVNLGWWAVSLLAPLIVSFGVFMLIYRWVPNHALVARDLWIGALIGAVGFELGKNLFSLYLENFARYDEVYGTLGGAMAFLFFVFVMSNLVILAADINSEIARDRGRHRSNEG